MNNCRAFIVVGTVAALTSLQAATLADADALYRQKKWIPAIKAYETFTSERSGGVDCWRVRLCASKAYENAGDRKSAMTAADRCAEVYADWFRPPTASEWLPSGGAVCRHPQFGSCGFA